MIFAVKTLKGISVTEPARGFHCTIFSAGNTATAATFTAITG
jgi:hypothetical protein